MFPLGSEETLLAGESLGTQGHPLQTKLTGRGVFLEGLDLWLEPLLAQLRRCGFSAETSEPVAQHSLDNVRRAVC